jgi:hypothetical protein
MMELQRCEVARIAASGTAPTLHSYQVQLLVNSSPPLSEVGLVMVVGIGVLATSTAILLLSAA